MAINKGFNDMKKIGFVLIKTLDKQDMISYY